MYFLFLLKTVLYKSKYSFRLWQQVVFLSYTSQIFSAITHNMMTLMTWLFSHSLLNPVNILIYSMNNLHTIKWFRFLIMSLLSASKTVYFWVLNVSSSTPTCVKKIVLKCELRCMASDIAMINANNMGVKSYLWLEDKRQSVHQTKNMQ